MIHVIGNAVVDSVIRVERFPRPGETIVALGASEDLGGKGANQAVVASRCGAPVHLVAPIGDDALGERIRSSLDREGVQTDGLTTSAYGTDRCVITVDRHGENTILRSSRQRAISTLLRRRGLSRGSVPVTSSSCRAICGRTSRASVLR